MCALIWNTSYISVSILKCSTPIAWCSNFDISSAVPNCTPPFFALTGSGNFFFFLRLLLLFWITNCKERGKESIDGTVSHINQTQTTMLMSHKNVIVVGSELACIRTPLYNFCYITNNGLKVFVVYFASLNINDLYLATRSKTLNKNYETLNFNSCDPTYSTLNHF